MYACMPIVSIACCYAVGMSLAMWDICALSYLKLSWSQLMDAFFVQRHAGKRPAAAAAAAAEWACSAQLPTPTQSWPALLPVVTTKKWSARVWLANDHCQRHAWNESPSLARPPTLVYHYVEDVG